MADVMFLKTANGLAYASDDDREAMKRIGKIDQEAQMLTQERLKEVLHYDPETGRFTRKSRTAQRVRVGDIAGSSTITGYFDIGIDSKRYLSHRLAWLYIHGRWPEYNIDHINHDKKDNRICNLRDVSQRENTRNTSTPKDNTSGAIGVSFFKQTRRWEAYISAHGKKIRLGYYKNIEDAKKARKAAEIKYGYHFNHGAKI